MSHLSEWFTNFLQACTSIWRIRGIKSFPRQLSNLSLENVEGPCEAFILHVMQFVLELLKAAVKHGELYFQLNPYQLLHHLL